MISELINMHGYGIYVWSCYGITAFFLGYNVLKPIIIHRKAKNFLEDFNKQNDK